MKWPSGDKVLVYAVSFAVIAYSITILVFFGGVIILMFVK